MTKTVMGSLLKNVLFSDRTQAEAQSGLPDWAVISITAGREPAAIKKGFMDVLRIQCHDTDDEHSPYAFSASMAADIEKFVDDVKARGATGILVHCDGGISRSAAVAKYIAEREDLPFNEHYSLYNRLVYSVLRNNGLVAKNAVKVPFGMYPGG